MSFRFAPVSQPHPPSRFQSSLQTREFTVQKHPVVRTVNMWLVFYSCKHHVTFSCVYQSQCTRMRPVIGLVACHSKCSQPIRGGAQEAGERTWTLQQFVHFKPLRDQHLTLVPERCKHGPLTQRVVPLSRSLCVLLLTSDLYTAGQDGGPSRDRRRCRAHRLLQVQRPIRSRTGEPAAD